MVNHIKELENMVQNLKGQLKSKNIPKALSLNEEDYNDKLINLIFKSKSYAYQMVLSESFENQLYKEKNFNIYLKLVDSESNSIRNCIIAIIKAIRSRSVSRRTHRPCSILSPLSPTKWGCR